MGMCWYINDTYSIICIGFFLTQPQKQERENSSEYFSPYCCGGFRFLLFHLDTLTSESLPGATAAPYNSHTQTQVLTNLSNLLFWHSYKSKNNTYHYLNVLCQAASCASCCRQTRWGVQVWKCAKLVLCVCVCCWMLPLCWESLWALLPASRCRPLKLVNFAWLLNCYSTFASCSGSWSTKAEQMHGTQLLPAFTQSSTTCWFLKCALMHRPARQEVSSNIHLLCQNGVWSLYRELLGIVPWSARSEPV